MKTVTAQIPFTGWYHSDHDDLINREIEFFFEYNDSDIPDALYFKADYSAMHAEYMPLYVRAFSSAFEDVTGMPLPLEFEEMTSPREYNFATDRLFCKVPFDALKAVFDMVRETEAFENTIKERHTSRDGFCSFYSNDVEEWREKPFEEYDHNEIHTVILAALALHGEEFDSNGRFCAWELLENDSGNGRISACVYKGIPDSFFTFAQLQRSAGKPLDYESVTESPEYKSYIEGCIFASCSPMDFDDWKKAAEDPSFVPPYRCPETLDMFATN